MKSTLQDKLMPYIFTCHVDDKAAEVSQSKRNPEHNKQLHPAICSACWAYGSHTAVPGNLTRILLTNELIQQIDRPFVFMYI